MQMSLINKKLQEYIELEREASNQILEALTLYIYQTQANIHDLHILSKILPEESISKLISYYDGDLLQLPTKEEYRNYRLLAVSFFLKEIQGWSWGDIKDFLNLPDKDEDLLSTISLGKQIKSIREDIVKDLFEALKSIPNEELHTTIHDYIERTESYE